jgi:hypothetical protein
LAKPLDEVAWRSWVLKGRARDRRSSAAHGRVLKWVSIAGLLAAAGLWSSLTPYEVVVRFIVAAGAMVMMLQAIRKRHYATAALFGAIALLYNPVAPVFNFSVDWQRVLVVMTAVPFVAALAWRNVRLAHDD